MTAELRRLLAEATSGPWIVATPETKSHGAEVATIEYGIRVVRPDDRSLIEPGDPLADAALIVVAVNALPALLDRLDALEAVARVALAALVCLDEPGETGETVAEFAGLEDVADAIREAFAALQETPR